MLHVFWGFNSPLGQVHTVTSVGMLVKPTCSRRCTAVPLILNGTQMQRKMQGVKFHGAKALCGSMQPGLKKNKGSRIFSLWETQEQQTIQINDWRPVVAHPYTKQTKTYSLFKHIRGNLLNLELPEPGADVWVTNPHLFSACLAKLLKRMVEADWLPCTSAPDSDSFQFTFFFFFYVQYDGSFLGLMPMDILKNGL